jgi:succinyl-CoA synthetase beta subunit
MNLHEYQGKNILHSFGVKIPVGIVVETPEQALLAAEKIYNKTFSTYWVIKAQINAGGRSKAGGVKIAKSLEEVNKKSSEILGTYLVTKQTSKKGKLVSKVMIEQYVYLLGKSIPKEYYISILIDRSKGKTVIIYSTKGGINIEKVAKNEQEKIFIEEIDPLFGIQKFQIKKIIFNLGLENESKQFKNFITCLYKAYKASDASLVEINPLLKTSDNKIIAIDTKIILDKNACYRHMNYLYMRNLEEEDPLEVSALNAGLNFVKLDGNVGCIVNGAGLAMATMDIIQFAGGKPANFLDIGGTADSERVEKSIRLILNDKDVSIIFINIFGGIVRCELVAKGIVVAYQRFKCELSLPLIVRLQGTNNKKAKKMMDEIGLKVITVVTLKQAAEKIHEFLTKKNL